MGFCLQSRLRLDVLQGLRCQEPFPGQGPGQNKIRPIYLISDCSKPISTVIYSVSGSLALHLFCFVPRLWLCVPERVPVSLPVCVIVSYDGKQKHCTNMYN